MINPKHEILNSEQTENPKIENPKQDGFVKSQKTQLPVIPAQAGIQSF